MIIRGDALGSEAWALLVETTTGGVEVYRGGALLMSAKQIADRIIAERPDVRQITVYPVEGSHAEGHSSWIRGQDSAWQSVRAES